MRSSSLRVYGTYNTARIFVKHPLFIWKMISYREGRRIIKYLLDGTGEIHLSNDGWKEFGKYIRDNLCHRFTK